MNKRVVVLANCQVQSIAKGLAGVIGDENVLSMPIHLFGSKHFVQTEEKLKLFLNDPETIYLTFHLSEKFGYLSTNSLKAANKNVKKMSNIYFSGLHPDITYLGDSGGRMPSPVGDYHSIIILQSYLLGLSPKECITRFNGNEYERLSFFDLFNKSQQELLKRDEDADIKFAQEFLDGLNQLPSLYTVNHPTAWVFQRYTSYILKSLNFKHHDFPIGMSSDYLAHSALWPIYPEVAEHHNLNYRTPMVFKQPDQIGGKILDLDEFCHASYEIYDLHDQRIRSARQVGSIMSLYK